MIGRLVLTPAIRDALFAHARDGAAATDRADDSGDGSDPRAGRDAGEPNSERRTAPVEVCGVLGGTRRDAAAETARDAPAETDVAVVTDCRRVPNVADRPSARYELDPAATVDAIEALETAGLEHVGFYHSHPRGPRTPSRTDQARATWPGYVYLVVSLADEPVIGAWRWTGESFVQLPVEVAEDPRSDR